MSKCLLCSKELDEDMECRKFCEDCWYELFEIKALARADLGDVLSPEEIARVDMRKLAAELEFQFNGFIPWEQLKSLAESCFAPEEA